MQTVTKESNSITHTMLKGVGEKGGNLSNFGKQYFELIL